MVLVTEWFTMRAIASTLAFAFLLGCSGDAGAPSAETTVDESGTAPVTCEDGRDAATAFLEQSRACVDDGDCTTLSTPCLVDNVCGHSSVAVGFDVPIWSEIARALDECAGCLPESCAECSVCRDGACTIEKGCG